MPETEFAQSFINENMSYPVKSENENDVWSFLVNELSKEISKQSLNTWIKPCQFVSITDGIIFIRVPNQFFYEWIESHYSQLIKTILSKHLNKDIKLEYVIPQEHKNKDIETLKEEEISVVGNLEADQVAELTISDRPKYGIELNQLYHFDNFLAIKNNIFAKKAAMAVASNPGMYTPLVIYGSTGVGKTHLLQAIGNQVCQKNSNDKVVYITAERYAQQYVRAMKSKDLEPFVDFFRNADVLLIDDIHFLGGKKKLQEELFHTINDRLLHGAQVVVSCNKPPAQLPQFEAEFVSRLQSGLIVDLKVPDEESRLSIIYDYFEKQDVHIEKNIARYIAKQIRQNVSELEGFLIRLIAHVSLMNEEITLDLVKKTMIELLPAASLDSVNQQRRKPSCDQIVENIAELYGKPPELIRGKSRKRDIAKIRKLAAYCCKQMTDLTITEIGDYFQRSHAFVVYAIQDMENYLENEPELQYQIEKIKSLVID
ncbi:MAG: chromosomal replication initiator protein DnaA [Calditrichia bacterium]